MQSGCQNAYVLHFAVLVLASAVVDDRSCCHKETGVAEVASWYFGQER